MPVIKDTGAILSHAQTRRRF